MSVELELKRKAVNNGDYVFLAKAESAPMVEHVCKVDYIDGDVLATTKCVTLIKQMTPNGISVSPVPSFGLVTSNNNATGDKEQILINLNNFDFVGKCTDESIINQIEEVTSPLITDPGLVNQMKPTDDSQDYTGLHLV